MKCEQALQQIANIVAQYRNLGMEKIDEENKLCAKKIALMRKEYDNRKKINNVLNKHIQQNQTLIEDLKISKEEMDIKLIRAKTFHKKLMKNIEKLKSLNASRIKLEVGDNDKLKMAKSKLKLALTKSLTMTYVKEDSKGFTINVADAAINKLQLNRSNSKETNREIIWNNIGQVSSHHSDKWAQLMS